MPMTPVSEKQMRKAAQAFAEHREFGPAARSLRLDTKTFQNRLARAIHKFGGEYGLTLDMLPQWILDRARIDAVASPAPKPREFTREQLPASDMDTDELVAHRIKQFEKRRAHEERRKLIKVKVHLEGPVGVLHFGDPHVDDDGTDIAALKAHKELCAKTEGLFAANVGDITNNWVGRLAKLYADQATTASQAWQLAEWLIGGTDWLYLIGGNHDAWSGAGDPLKWIKKQEGSVYESSECRLELQLPNGQKPRINARHDFAGHSQYNAAHGPMKATIFGVRDHVAICGHRHKSGYGLIKDPTTGIVCHTIQVASYKTYDRYAREKGFRDQTLSPCALTVFDTRRPDDHPDYVHTFWDPFAGADYLNFLRRKAKAA